jgi:hypothetical protein
MAMLKNQTIKELFLNTILTSYKTCQLQLFGITEEFEKNDQMINEIYNTIIRCD